jgi:hypothetical protein
MSMRLYTWVWQQRVRRVVQHVLLYLAERADEDGQCWPSVETIAEVTGWRERAVRYALDRLEQAGLIKRERRHRSDGARSSDLIVLCLPASGAARDGHLAAPGATPSGTKRRNLAARGAAQIPPSEPLSEPKNMSAIARADVERLCAHLANRITGNGSKPPTITDKWRTAARLMLDNDHRTEQDIHAAIDWCQTDEFWRGNVLSMPTLRKQYDRLRLQAQRPGRSSPAADAFRLADEMEREQRRQQWQPSPPKELPP